MAEERRGQEEEARFKRVTRHQTKPLERDEAVWLQNKDSGKWNIKGFIRGARPHGRSYIVETVRGSLFLRNRKFLKPRKVQEEQEEQEGSTGVNQIEQEPVHTQKKAEREAAVIGAGAGAGAGPREPASQHQHQQETARARTYAKVAQGHSGVTTRSRVGGCDKWVK